ncbi:MAG: FxsA family protein [Nitrospirae bacterium]|nr:FxsA family protein [Nitrospirota bacterium]
MLLKLALLFTLLPLAELYVLIKIGAVIGGLNTLLLVLVTGVAGAYLARMEGLRVLTRARENLRQGMVPAEELVDGILIFIAGVLLVTPGVITDCMGLLLLFPPTRRYFKIRLRRRFDRMVAQGSVRVYRGPDNFGPF